MIIEFTVDDIPPKKDGANSMWGKPVEVARIISLRQAVEIALQEQGVSVPITSYISLRLTIFIPRLKLETIGDLDNFITGICDGLQAAHPRSIPDYQFSEAGIDPTKAFLQNDSRVLKIQAEKNISDGECVFYYVSIELLKGED